MSHCNPPCVQCEVERLRAENLRLQSHHTALLSAAVFAVMTLEHALTLGYLGEGSTKGMAEDAIAQLDAALKPSQNSATPNPPHPAEKGSDESGT